MSEKRLDNLEDAMVEMANNINKFLAAESARQVRDEHQLKLNEKIEEFIGQYREHDKPVIDESRKYHGYINYIVGKVLLPVIIISVLTAAGVTLYEKNIKEEAKTTTK
jgi:hypothetical protein